MSSKPCGTCSSKTSVLPILSGSEGLSIPGAQGSAKLRSMGSCPKLKFRLTHDFPLITFVSSSGWLPMYAYSQITDPFIL